MTRNLRLALALAWRASPSSLARYMLLGIVNAAMTPLAVYLGAHLVNALAGARVERTTMREALPMIVALSMAAGVQRAMTAYMGSGRNLFVRRVQLEAERRLLAHAAALDTAHFDDPQWHDRLTRAKRDVSWRPGDLTWSVLGLPGNMVTIVLMASLLASLDRVLLAFAVSAAIASLLLERRVTSRLYAFFYREAPEEREREYLADLLVQRRMAKELRAYVVADHLLARYRTLSDLLYRKREEMYRAATTMSLFGGVVTAVSLGLAYTFVASRSLAGRIDPGGVVLVIGAFTAVAGTLSQISSTLIAVDQHSTFLDDYFSFLAAGSHARADAPLQALPERIAVIEFDHVTFCYPGSAQPVLRDLNLTIRAGELVALVGDNGAGKSTLAKLLLRLYDPTGGRIRIGGVEAHDVDASALRRRIGVVFQDFATYEFSVRDNVTLGRPEREPDDDRVFDALAMAHADRLVLELPAGLDSRLGRLFAGGHDLSGGEAQRVALARFVYRDADIWILDEPTSALDPEAEALIFAGLKQQLGDRIAIVISHRLSTVRLAHRIVVMDKGRIAEIGSHEELLARGGRYAELFELQATSYR